MELETAIQLQKHKKGSTVTKKGINIMNYILKKKKKDKIFSLDGFVFFHFLCMSNSLI